MSLNLHEPAPWIQILSFYIMNSSVKACTVKEIDLCYLLLSGFTIIFIYSDQWCVWEKNASVQEAILWSFIPSPARLLAHILQQPL